MNRLLARIVAVCLLICAAVPAAANGRADLIRNLDPALQRHIQKVLKEKGYYKGKVDGRFGPGSALAVKKFRAANGIAGESDDTSDDLTQYLTPKLAKTLLGVETGVGTDELSDTAQYDLLKKLRLKPTPGRWEEFLSPND